MEKIHKDQEKAQENTAPKDVAIEVQTKMQQELVVDTKLVSPELPVSPAEGKHAKKGKS